MTERSATSRPAAARSGRDAFFGFDSQGRLVSWNEAAAAATGGDDALAGRSFADCFAVDADGPEALLGEGTVRLDLRTGDGEQRAGAFEAHRVRGEGPAVVLIGRGSAREDDRRVRVLREFHEIVSDAGRSFEEQVEALLALGRGELGTEYGSLSRIEGEEYVFEIVDADDDDVEAGDVVPLSATNCELAVSESRTLVLGDVARDAPEQTDRTGYHDWGISCYIGAPVFVDDGDAYGTLCFYDTTPRAEQFSNWEVTLVDLMSRWVSYELTRERTNERLERQNERLERFASIVSHDLRNPLNVADGSLQLAKETGEAEHFERARSALDRMDALIDDLLTLARAGETIGETEPIDLDTVCERCWGDLSTVEATLRVETERTIHADPTRLQQLFENFFRNSIEHGSTGSQAEPDDSVEHGSTSSRTESGDSVDHGGAGVTITVGDLDDGFYVEDDGRGISEAERETVFDRGYTTKEGGTGFGLDIVAEVARAHGWEIEIAESEDGGARFEVTGVDVA